MMLRRRNKVLLTVCTVFFIIGLLLYWLFMVPTLRPLRSYIQQSTTEIIWWTEMPSEYKSIRYCDTHICAFGGDRRELSRAQAVLFYASSVSIADLPLPRLPHHIWALLHEESPRNVPYIRHADVLQHFNYTSTFSRYSDFPLTTHYLRHPDNLTSARYLVPVGQKTLYRAHEGLAPLVFLQSDCDTMSGRDEYVRQLMKHIAVDSYGDCLNNRQLPRSLRDNYLNQLYAPELLRLLAKYKFILSYENGVCHDYLSEKFWRPLVVGSVPIYFGSPTARDWQPNVKSIIHVGDFASPRALAAFVTQLDRNDSAYNAYLDHKYEQLRPIANDRLRRELAARNYPVADDDLFAAFECFVCRQLHETPPAEQHMATLAHYDCPVPLPYPPMEPVVGVNTAGGEWENIMATGQCQAQVLDALWRRNANYTRAQFEERMQHAYATNVCH